MPHPRKRREGKLVLIYGSILIVLLVVFFSFLNAVVSLAIRDFSVGDVREQKEKEYEAVQKRYREAEDRLRGLQSPLGREEEYRNMYGLVRPGEESVTFVDTHTQPALPKEKGFDILKFLNLRD